MSAVMAMCWEGLAVCTEISVMADCTLVAVTNNILDLVHAERAVTVDAIVTL